MLTPALLGLLATPLLAGHLPAPAPPPQEAQQSAFVEVVAPRTECFQAETLELQLRIGVETRFLAENLVPLFPRALDLPLQVELPWFDAGPEGTQPEAAEAPLPGSGASFALNQDLARARRAGAETRDGRSFELFELERRYRVERSGPLVLTPPSLRLAFATRFEDDFIRGRRALDRREVLLAGSAPTLVVHPLPTTDRPLDFSGAVGDFRVRASAEPRDLVLGQSLRLTLTIEGRGNLESFDRPPLGDLDGFRVGGALEERGRERRLLTVDLTPRDESVARVPALHFSYFDPEAARYRTLETQPISILVRPAPVPPPVETVPEATEDAASTAGPEAGSGPRNLSVEVLGLALIAAALLALALRSLARARRGARRDPTHETPLPLVSAAAVFRARIAAPESDLAQALIELLASLLRCDPSAVTARHLAARLQAVGVPAELSVRLTERLEGLLAARYAHGSAGVHGPDDARALEELLGQLEQHLARRPG